MVGMSLVSGVSSEVFAVQVVVLDKRCIHAQAVNVPPFLLAAERIQIRSYGSCDALNSVGCGRYGCVEQADHVIARLPISKGRLVRKVLEEA